jgi:diguanylate cyclase (GGDEF)-like protein
MNSINAYCADLPAGTHGAMSMAAPQLPGAGEKPSHSPDNPSSRVRSTLTHGLLWPLLLCAALGGIAAAAILLQLYSVVEHLNGTTVQMRAANVAAHEIEINVLELVRASEAEANNSTERLVSAAAADASADIERALTKLNPMLPADRKVSLEARIRALNDTSVRLRQESAAQHAIVADITADIEALAVESTKAASNLSSDSAWPSLSSHLLIIANRIATSAKLSRAEDAFALAKAAKAWRSVLAPLATSELGVHAQSRHIADDIDTLLWTHARKSVTEASLRQQVHELDALLDDEIQRLTTSAEAVQHAGVERSSRIALLLTLAVFLIAAGSGLVVSIQVRRVIGDMQLCGSLAESLADSKMALHAPFWFREPKQLAHRIGEVHELLSATSVARGSYQSLLDAVGTRRIVLRMDGTIVDLTDAAASALHQAGITAVAGTNASEVFGAHFDIAALWPVIERGLLSGFHWHIGAEGRQQTFSLTAIVLRDSDSSEQRLLLALIPIDSLAISAAPLCIGKEGRLLVSATGTIVAANEALYLLIGRIDNGVLGMPLASLWPEFDNVSNLAALHRVTGLRENQESYTLALHAHRLGAAPSGAAWLITADDITQIETANSELERLAFRDPLTDLSNRRYFSDVLARTLRFAAQRGESCALLYLDINNFKDVNDALGHALGDELLKCVAERLRHNLRDSDEIARLGGDEFAIILTPGQSTDQVNITAQRVSEALLEPLTLGGRIVRPSASIGIAYYPSDASDATELLKAADAAMYEAKRQASRHIAFFDPRLTAAAQARLTLEHELREALANGQFELHYQPQLAIGKRLAVAGVEALVRWRHPSGRIIAPSDFILVAERIGLITALGEWVLREACRQQVAWREAGLNLSVAVNVSPAQMHDPSFPDTVRAVIAETGILPARLHLEITESMAQDGAPIINCMNALRSIGVRIAIDDFGTGYSSLGVLRKMPVDYLKIDRAFILDLLESANGSVFLGTIVGLAHSLGMLTVAEGVEKGEQLNVIRGLGVDFVQGYLFSKPVLGADLPSCIEQLAITSNA